VRSFGEDHARHTYGQLLPNEEDRTRDAIDAELLLAEDL
jgi:hypothetical protein